MSESVQGMAGIEAERQARAHLHKLPYVHHRNSITDMLRSTQIISDR
jgi:hypothetical protein